MNKVNEDNQNLIAFWNDALKLSEEDKKEFKQYDSEDYMHLAPAEKLFLAVKELGNKDKVLDYGCGNAWAGIIASRCGCPHVDAVDVIKDGIESAKVYAETFKGKINALYIEPNWLESVPDETYDGIVCSNVLDVVPLETAKYIIKHLARISKKDADVLFGLNFYMDVETAKQRRMQFENGNCLYINGVLRLLNFSDKEWEQLFSPYFDIIKLDYFAWPTEQKETRRLFHLKNTKK